MLMYYIEVDNGIVCVVLSAGPPATEYDTVIVGGGHNGLVAANYLARSGVKTAVLERRHVLGF